MPKRVYVLVGAAVLLSINFCVSMAGDRSSNPTYIRTPRIYELPHASPTQQSLTMPSAPTHSAMTLRPIIQPTPIEPHVEAHTTRENEQQRLKEYQQAEIQEAREKEIEGYTHMYGTSDTYGGLDLKS